MDDLAALVVVLQIGIDPLAVQRHGLGDFVVDQHPGRAADDGAAGGLGPEPGGVDVATHVVGEFQMHVDLVLHLEPEHAMAGAAHAFGRLAHQIEHDRHVVHADVPDHVLGAARPPEVEPLVADGEQFADLAGGDVVPHPGDRGLIDEQMPHHQDHVPVLGGVDQLARLGGTVRERLLDEHVLAGLDRGHGDLEMRRRGRGDRHRLAVGGQRRAVIREQRRLRVAFAVLVEPFGVAVDDATERVQLVEIADDVLAPGTGADHHDSHTSAHPSRNCNARQCTRSTRRRHRAAGRVFRVCPDSQARL